MIRRVSAFVDFPEGTPNEAIQAIHSAWEQALEDHCPCGGDKECTLIAASVTSQNVADDAPFPAHNGVHDG